MKKGMMAAVAWALMILSGYWIVTQLNVAELLVSARQLLTNGDLLVLMTLGYAASFWLRSIAWSKQIRGRQVRVSQLWYYHQIGLLVNHLLPVKGGEIVRAALLRNHNNLGWSEALFSVGINRFLDIAGLLFVSIVGVVLIAPAHVQHWYGQTIVLGATSLIVLVAASLWGARWLKARGNPFIERFIRSGMSKRDWLIVFLWTTAGWMLEAVVVWSVVFALHGNLLVGQALLVHVLTIIGQTFHVTPGGIGTYEAVMSTLLHQVAGHPLSFALQVAILSHGFKFMYSFIVGGYAALRMSLSPLSFFRRALAESRRNTDEESVQI